VGARVRRAQRHERDVGRPAPGLSGSSSPSSWAERLAKAVAARPRALVLDADNRSQGWVPLEQAWARPGAYAVDSGPERARDEAAAVARWCRALRSGDWRGMAGASELALAEELARRALSLGRTRVLLPMATAALGAGVSLSTARRGLRRLMAKGWIALIQAPGPTWASVYALAIPAAHAGSETGEGPLRPVWELEGGDLGADVARWRALGKSRVRVLRELRAGPRRLEDLAAVLKVTTSTVRAHLRRLDAFGLVSASGGWWEVRLFNSDEVAGRFGTRGHRARDEIMYAVARQARKEARRARAHWRRTSPRAHHDAASLREAAGSWPRAVRRAEPPSVRLVT